MSLANLVLLFVYAIGLSIGQVLFKISADAAKRGGDGPFWRLLLGTWQFYLAIALYGVLTLVWVWILSRIPLSRAYPSVVVAFVVTPLLAAWLFGETLGPRYFVSLGLILAGLTVLTSEPG